MTGSCFQRLVAARLGSLGRSGIALGVLLASSACTTLGGNVSGDFSCRAPGGTCAPMSAIDARAVETLIDTSASPAVKASAAASVRIAGERGPAGVVGRTGERTLRIVFPAHVDAVGVLHDEATAHAVVEGAAWTFNSAAASGGDAAIIPEISRSPAPSSLREAIAGARAPAIEGLESLPAQAPHPIVGIDAPVTLGPPLQPSVKALAAARGGHRIGRPGRPAGGATAAAPPPGARGTIAVPRPHAPAAKAPTGIAGAIAAGRVRAMASPALSTLGTSRPAEPDLDDVFATRPDAEGVPK